MGENEGLDFVEHPMKVRTLGLARVLVFSDGSGSALIKGDPVDGTLVRIQSACQYGEIYGSLECDCRAQLDHSLELIAEEEHGVIVHLLNQEGRGAGLVTKAEAYRKMTNDQVDSFQAYRSFGLKEDTREYLSAIQVLKGRLGLHSVRLLTNNPRKIEALRAGGITVAREAIIKLDHDCRGYFLSKLANGHLQDAGVSLDPVPSY